MCYNNDYDAILKSLESPGFSKFISNILLLDAHTVPYHVTFGKTLDRIHWIPMEPFDDEELKKQIVCFLATKDIHITIPQDNRLNQSPRDKQKIFTAVQDIFLSTEPIAELGLLFAEDVKFYNNLLNTYIAL
jgi:hypothetical protein